MYFLTERIGSVAALSTIKYMKEHDTWKQIEKNVKYIKELEGNK